MFKRLEYNYIHDKNPPEVTERIGVSTKSGLMK